MQSRFRRAALAACLVFSAPLSAAEADGLTLGAALERARHVHPELADFALERRAREAEQRAAERSPAPELELLLEDVAGSGEHRGFDAAQSTLSLSQVFERGGKRPGRAAVAQARLSQLGTEQAMRQLDLVAEIERRFVAVVASQERVSAAGEALSLAMQVRTAVDERVRAAASPRAEGLRAQVALAEAELELEDARHDLETARFELAAAMGLAAPDFGDARGELFALPAAPAFDALRARLEAAPDLQRFAQEARLREAQLQLAASEGSGDLRATLGLRHFEASDDQALVAGLSLPLFAGRAAAPGIEAAQAEQARIAPAREATLLKLRARLFTHYQEMEHARHVVTTLRGTVLPTLAETLRQAEYAWRRGRYSYLEWSEAQRRQLEARGRSIEAAAEFHTHRIEIERLIGDGLGDGAVLP